jgi:hypothetical protein
MKPPDNKVGRTSVRSSPAEGGLKSTLPEPPDEAPDVPGFRTWGGIYGFAFAVFVAVVAALTLFTRAFA